MHYTSTQLTTHAASLSSDIKDWGTLVATLLLVGVTAWYVILTKRMADAAEISAQSSQDAAKTSKEAAETSRDAAAAARKAADAAVAELSVQFSVRPFFVGGVPPERLGVTVTGAGASVFIHGARLWNAMRRGEWPHRSESFSLGLHDVELEPESDLPLRVHAGESVQFLVPDDLTRGKFSDYRRVPTITKVGRAARAALESAGAISDRDDVRRRLHEIRNPTIPFDLHDLSLYVLVHYSLDEHSPVVPRQVSNERTSPTWF